MHAPLIYISLPSGLPVLRLALPSMLPSLIPLSLLLPLRSRQAPSFLSWGPYICCTPCPEGLFHLCTWLSPLLTWRFLSSLLCYRPGWFHNPSDTLQLSLQHSLPLRKCDSCHGDWQLLGAPVFSGPLLWSGLLSLSNSSVFLARHYSLRGIYLISLSKKSEV